MRLRHIVPPLCSGVMLLACGFAEVFRSPQVGDVVLAYTGPTTVRVGDTIPIAVTVTVAGDTVPNPRLVITSSDTSLIVLTPRSDTLIAVNNGPVPDTLTITYVASIFTKAYPTIVQPIKVNP